MASSACVCQWGYYPADTQLKGLPSQLQAEKGDANAFVTCHIVEGVSNVRVIRCTHHTHLPRSATVTHIFLVFHQQSRLRVCGDAEAVGILNLDYLTRFMGVQFKGKPSL